ncbi:replication protein [Bacillus sp. 3255]|uniref:replication protein n=1 Tax=Bacillus sp. 3255 TaxID=2817904 RepID=UPI00285BB9B8|nr:replication protein [Bacillus sp. 3255]MDR6883060.1 phage replication O-like protein O [Bacillus sp. 3255]
MASPQKEKGFTPVANEILDQICQYNLNGAQLRIIMKIWRQTYGYGKKDHEFAISFIQMTTKLAKSTVKKEVAALIKSKVLIVTKEETNTEGRMLGFNKNYEDWMVPKGSESVKKTGQVDLFDELEVHDCDPPNTNLEVYDCNPPEVYDHDPQSKENGYFEVYDCDPIKRKRSLNKLFKDKSNEYIFNYFYSNYPRRISKAAARKSWDKLSKEKGFDAARIISNTINFAETCKLLETKTNFIPHPSTYLNQKRYEDYSVVDPEGLVAEKKSKVADNVDFLLGNMGGGTIDRTRSQTLIGEGGRGLPE